MDRIRVALIGTSFARNVQAIGFQRHPGFEIVAIAGSDPNRARAIADALDIPKAYSDWRRLLDEVACDLVSVVTPVDLHHSMMLAALERERHVLCEKPTALNRFQAAEMRDRAAARGLVAAMNHEFRFFPARRHALELVRAGAIGTPRRGEILGRYPLWPLPQSRPMTWLAERNRGGGVLGALGSHHTDCLRTFFGEPLRAWASVRIDQPIRGLGSGAGRATADDACTVHYEFKDGATGLIELGAASPYRWERFEIHGSEATLRWDETGYRLWRITAGVEPEEMAIPERWQIERQEGDHPLVAPFRILVERLFRAVANREPMEPNFDDAVAVQSALDAARTSSRAGAWMSVSVPTPSPVIAAPA